uniref:Uncharacterized protein n=1 Tax=Octopus bimaculoides TaxID=37653 RepID=A0A0L8HPZ7_OCTBM
MHFHMELGHTLSMAGPGLCASDGMGNGNIFNAITSHKKKINHVTMLGTNIFWSAGRKVLVIVRLCLRQTQSSIVPIVFILLISQSPNILHHSLLFCSTLAMKSTTKRIL